MIYVMSMPRELRGRLLAHHRLYAYPQPPEPPPAGGFTILDSGAFGLAKAGAPMSNAHLVRLREHYLRWQAERVLCIAPDEFLNAHISMRRFEEWHTAASSPPIVPVIQFHRKRKIDAYSAMKQVEFYSAFPLPRYDGRAVFAISNPMLRANEATHEWRTVAAIVRRAIPDAWLHVLGAGWDVHDVANWRDLNAYDSIDSIAYYTDAQAGKCWQTNTISGQSWQDIAINNAAACAQIARDKH